MTRAKKLKIIENPNTLVEMFLNDKGEHIRVGSMSVDIINNEVYELKKGIDQKQSIINKNYYLELHERL